MTEIKSDVYNNIRGVCCPLRCDMKIIAISGPAGVGKDSLGKMIASPLMNCAFNVHHLPIAYALKKELENSVKEKYGLNVFSEVREEKEVFRNDLINYAELKRSQDSTYWILKWMKNVSNILLKYNQELFDNLFLVTDLRHAYLDFDDLHFIKSFGGLIIYVEQYLDNTYKTKKINPFRESESLNDSALKENSDFVFRWVHSDSIEDAWNNSIDKENLVKTVNNYIYE